MTLFQKKQAVLKLLALSLAFMPSVQAEEASLYDRLGGLAPISVVVSDFLDELVPDPLLNQNPAIDAARQAVPKPYLKYQVTAMVCQATGGPCQYHGRTMKDAHAHLNISEREWTRMEVIFRDLLVRHQVPEQEANELIAIVDSTKADIVVATSP
ncbi:MAG: group 1 truncated hemoglobin [Pseudomonadota bacterium]|nr:group 1 truncated hemoglobin [Pseudomonadota bacterium]